MNPTYRHTQPSTILLVFAGIYTIVMLLPVILANMPFTIFLFVVGLMVIIVALFGWLTLQIDQEFVRWSFGIGLFHGKIRLAEIQDAQTVRNPWWYGWGIRLVPSGWLYNASGLDAVELKLANGKRVRLGTDEPLILLNAIQQAKPR